MTDAVKGPGRRQSRDRGLGPRRTETSTIPDDQPPAAPAPVVVDVIAVAKYVIAVNRLAASAAPLGPAELRQLAKLLGPLPAR